MNALTTRAAFLAPLVALILSCCSAALADNDNDGFIYGKVTMNSGREYQGFLRWGKEEAFWDDLFHSLKEDLPYDRVMDRQGVRRPQKRGRWTFSGVEISWESDNDKVNRIFISHFGDIEKIETTGSDGADIYMKTGEVYEVSGYSNDVSSKIHVTDADLGDIDLLWKRIDTIEFMPAPSSADPGVYRMHGKVETDSGLFEGFIQWDKEECLSTDLLDGESEDGDVELKFGSIRTISRRGRRGTEVELKDGRSFSLRGTNDVNSSNRGIMVEDPRYGRLTISWGEFDSVVFSDPGASGNGYNSYKPYKELKGVVKDIDGETYRGIIIFDLDESESWEMLNGSFHDIEFDIPFGMIKRIEPLRYDESKVTLFNGESLKLEDSQDVSERNDGILIFEDDDNDPTYVDWGDVEYLEFQR
jgi:hypothetical protein